MNFVFSVVLFTFLIMDTAHAGRTLDEIVAVVEDEVIFKSELNRAMRTTRRPRGMSNQAFRDYVLDRLITDKAQQLAVERSGVVVTEAEVDAAISTIAAANRIGVSSMKKILRRQGRSYDSFRRNIALQLKKRNFYRAELGSLLQVSNSEIENYLKRHGKGHKSAQTEVQARQILLRPGEQLSSNRAKAELEKLRARILTGESFADLARTHSDDTASALRGGNLGWVNINAGTIEFRRVINRLKPKELSRPFKTTHGWHLVEVIDKRVVQSADLEARRSAEEKIRQRKIEENIDMLAHRIREQAYVEKRQF